MRILGTKKHRKCEEISGKKYKFCKVMRRSRDIECINIDGKTLDIIDLKNKKIVSEKNKSYYQ